MKRSAGWNQEVTDDEGRRRFHGAFTGGFSAGYFNSVGTKDGWQPAAFQSSRHERGRVAQRAEDFMDEDDDPLLGKRLETTAQYDTLQSGARQLRAQQQQQQQSHAKPRNAFEAQVLSLAQPQPTASAHPAVHFLDELVRPVNDSIGAKLLNQMGWKEGHGIGPRVRKKKISDGAAQSTALSNGRHEADEHADESEVVYIPPRNSIDVAAFPKPKLDKYGAGFDPYVDAPEFQRYKQQKESAQVQKQQQRQVVTFADAMKITSGSYETVTAFGLSALEDNDDLDVYGTTSMSEFDTAIGPARLTNGKEIKRIDSVARESVSKKEQQRGPAFGSDGRPALPGFELAYAKEKPPKAVALRLEVPSDFKPFHKFEDDETRDEPAPALYQKHSFSTGKHGQGSLMTAKQRAALLAEPTQSPSAPVDATTTATLGAGTGSVFDLLGEEQKARLFAAVAQAKLHAASSSVGTPASADAAPRREPVERQPLVRGAAGNQFRANISASIAKRFVSASTEQQESTEESKTEEAPASMTKPSYRTESVWIPNSLLCKRFRVKCLLGSGVPSSGRDATAGEEKRDLFDKELVPHLVEFAAERRVRQAPAPPSASTRDPSSAPAARKDGGGEDDDELPPLPISEKPAASLLRSIFEPSDESDVEEYDDLDDDDGDGDGDEMNAEPLTADRAAATRDARVSSFEQNSLADTGTRSAASVAPGGGNRRNDTQHRERLRGGRDRAAAATSVSSGDSSSSSDSEAEDEATKPALNGVTTDSTLAQRVDRETHDSDDEGSSSKRKKKPKKAKSSSKKHRRSHKKKKDAKKRRSSRHDDDDDDDDDDRRHRKKRKESKRSSSSSKKKRSRSRSRDRSEARASSSSSKHRRHDH